MNRIPRRVLILWLLVCAFTLAPSPVRAEETPTMAGSFHYVGGAAEEAQRQAAINVGIETMFFAIRPIARYRLNNATRTVPWVRFAFEGDQLHTTGPDRLDFRSPATGARVVNTWRGEKTTVSQRITAKGLVQSFVADEGSGSNEWTLSADGKTATCKVTIASKHLPKTIVFTQTYRRD